MRTAQPAQAQSTPATLVYDGQRAEHRAPQSGSGSQPSTPVVTSVRIGMSRLDRLAVVASTLRTPSKKVSCMAPIATPQQTSRKTSRRVYEDDGSRETQR